MAGVAAAALAFAAVVGTVALFGRADAPAPPVGTSSSAGDDDPRASDLAGAGPRLATPPSPRPEPRGDEGEDVEASDRADPASARAALPDADPARRGTNVVDLDAADRGDGADARPAPDPASDLLTPRPPRARIGRPSAWSDGDRVYAVAFSADARRVISAGEARAVSIRDRDTGRVVRRLEGHTGEVSALAVSPDGRRLLSGGYDGGARVWDLEAGTTIRTLPTGGVIFDVTFDASGRRAVTAGGFGAVILWDLESGAELRRFPLPETGNGAAFSADGARLAAVSSGGLLRVFDVASGAVLGEGRAHDTAAGEVAILPATEEILTSGGDGMLRLWSCDGTTLVREWKAHDERISSFALLPDGATVVSGGWDGHVRAWRVADGERLWDRDVTREYVIGVSVTSDGRAVAIGARDGMTRLFDAVTGEPATSEPDGLEGHEGTVHALAFVGGRLVSAGHDGTIRVWNVETRAWTRLVRAVGTIPTLLAAGDGPRFLAAGVGRIWGLDVDTGAETGRVDLGGAAVHALATDRSGTAVLSIAVGGGLRVDALGAASPSARFEDRSGALAASPSQALIALVGRESIDFLGTDGARVRTVPTGFDDVRFAGWFPDGRSLFVGNERRARRVDAATGRVLVEYGLPDARAGAVTPDGSLVILGGDDGAVVACDAASGVVRRRFTGHRIGVTCVVVSPDGRTALSGGVEGAIYLWDLPD